MTKKSSKIIGDLRLESWPGRNTYVLLRRIKRIYGVFNKARKKDESCQTTKGVYSPQENAIIDSAVKVFLRVLKTKMQLTFRFEIWMKRNSPNFLPKI
jgi:hypothetical protein